MHLKNDFGKILNVQQKRCFEGNKFFPPVDLSDAKGNLLIEKSEYLGNPHHDLFNETASTTAF